MAPPILQNTASIIGSGTSQSVSASLTSPTNQDYRILVVVGSEIGPGGVPLTVSTPAGWNLLYITPRGRGSVRSWVFGQVWTGSTPAGTLTFGFNTFYTVTAARVSGYTIPAIFTGPITPIITVPAFAIDSDTSMDAPTLNCQGDSLRLDFWSAFHNTNANSVSTVINVPAGQTGSAITRAAGTQGYITRVTSETRLTKGFTGIRTATMTDPAAAAVVSLAFGGWTVYNKVTSTPLSTTSVMKSGKKAVSLTTASPMALTSTPVGGRSVTVSTTTTLGVASTSERVFLTSTTLGLAFTGTATHDGTAASETVLDATATVDGTHANTSATTSTYMQVVSTAAARIQGGGQGPPASVVDQWTQQYVPSDKPLRFMFQEIRGSKRWISWDVPLVSPEITYTLSGPMIIRGRVGPEYHEAVSGIDAYATWLHVEEGGVIRGSAIVQPLAIDGQDLVIEAIGVCGYPQGMSFESEFSAIQIDPAEAMRQLWAYVQSYPDSKLGVTLDPTATPRRLGDPARIDVSRDSATGEIQYKEVQVDPDTGLTRVDQGSVPDYVFAKLLALGYPLYQDTETLKLVLLVHPGDLAMQTTGLPARLLVNPETGEYKVEIPAYTAVEAKPYEIAWWNDIDVGREIDNLAQQTPFDYAERATWDDDRLAVKQHIKIGYPRLGGKRMDLRFAEDENLLAAVMLRESPNFFASQVIVRGAGEGRKSIRAQAGSPVPTRLRRVRSLTDKTITDLDRAAALAVEELRRRFANLTVTEITIDAAHDNAPMGSFQVGDDILVQAMLPYYGELALWHRITSYTWRPDTDEVMLQLRRSEQWVYGRPMPN